MDCITSKSVIGLIPHCQDPGSGHPFLDKVVLLCTATPLTEQGDSAPHCNSGPQAAPFAAVPQEITGPGSCTAFQELTTDSLASLLPKELHLQSRVGEGRTWCGWQCLGQSQWLLSSQPC